MHHPVKVGQGGVGLTALEASDFSSTPVSRNENRYSFFWEWERAPRAEEFIALQVLTVNPQTTNPQTKIR